MSSNPIWDLAKDPSGITNAYYVGGSPPRLALYLKPPGMFSKSGKLTVTVKDTMMNLHPFDIDIEPYPIPTGQSTPITQCDICEANDVDPTTGEKTSIIIRVPISVVDAIVSIVQRLLLNSQRS